MRLKPAFLALSVQFALAFPLLADIAAVESGNADIERITIKGDFRQSSVQQISGSLAVVSEQDAKRQASQHLDDLLQQIGNVNFAAGASRGRFLQVRGVGERSEFVDAINPSVGLLVDGIDYSVLGLPSLLDLQQLEVFRGPEATRFGANAMAGMLNFVSQDPQFERETRLGATLANYNSSQLSLVHNDKISEKVAFRFAAEHQSSDGFIQNHYLNRKDTNNIDETHLHGKVRVLATDDLTLDALLNWHDIDNGYDAFSLDRNRVTLSDQPGQDKQDIKAGALKASYSGWSFADSQTQLSVLNAKSDYGFDEDWSFQAIHPWAYSTTDQYLRDRQFRSFNQRFQAKDNHWVLGFYASSQQTDLTRNYGDNFAQTVSVFQSELERQNLAWYGEYQHQLATDLTLTAGVRAERYSDDYHDSNQIVQQGDDWMWGGKLSLDYQLNEQALIYGLASRGYKVGGVNGEALAKALDPEFADIAAQLQQRPTFGPEALWNTEFGVKASTAEQQLVSRVAAFYMWRDDMQVNSWINRGTKFIGYLANAGSGRNYGLEMENRLQLNPSLVLFANASVLQSEIRDFVNDKGVDMTGREQAHAPKRQFSLALEWLATDAITVHGGVQHKDAYYYSDSHQARSDKMYLLNLKVSYQWQQLELSVWSRNALDEQYGVRGFYFGNDPRDEYEGHVYEQFGEPRRVGVSASYQF
ncbi:MAG: TonB-dependent receptor [Gammaproteobacteria bacterium]|nr:TonB-dependent receptor [Gammaproteobacteria bacterium]MBU2179862.1 TonB-dependent receptor [Gammaproteobacteria bacterium]MBU2224308.1 TonB-dependent receptor [Gammaproteobacteria bacterium]MBU2279309.1 TonB-dependent receptor [Gammaproteobacteria bacterium]MBU2428140.1 TonB-dependent receptor [Gammaproteobacteria bacterium]